MISNKKVNTDSLDLLDVFSCFHFHCIWLYCFKEANTKSSKFSCFNLHLVSFLSQVVMFYGLGTKSLDYSCSPLRLYVVSLLLIIQGIV